LTLLIHPVDHTAPPEGFCKTPNHVYRLLSGWCIPATLRDVGTMLYLCQVLAVRQK
jgi:hypothetical protein